MEQERSGITFKPTAQLAEAQPHLFDAPGDFALASWNLTDRRLIEAHEPLDFQGKSVLNPRSGRASAYRSPS